jgi:hypothetical protein
MKSFRSKCQIDLKQWRKANLSRFFHQEPCGSASGLHESLPSFIQRLEIRHSVPNGPFFLREIHPQPVSSSGSLLGTHSRSLLVGTGHAEQVARKVARECCEPNVLRLIQRPLSRHIALFRDVRHNVAWCPSCLIEWSRNENNTYRPLLWSLKSVKICPKHKVVLQECCPHCSTVFYHFSPTPWSTVCSKCGNDMLNGPRQYTRNHFEVFAATAIKDLLSWGWHHHNHAFPSNQFQININQAIDCVGGEYRLSAMTGLSRPVIHTWRREDRRPSLQGLIHLSFCFNVPIQSWVSEVLTAKTFSASDWKNIPATALNQRHPPLDYVRRRIVATLRDANAIPSSLSHTARQLNTSVYRLYRDCPKLAARVVKRFAKYRNHQKANLFKKRQEAVRTAIRDLLESGAPVSRSAVLRLLKERGMKSTWALKKIFAEEVQSA